jgi:hypothetical protein
MCVCVCIIHTTDDYIIIIIIIIIIIAIDVVLGACARDISHMYLHYHVLLSIVYMCDTWKINSSICMYYYQHGGDK